MLAGFIVWLAGTNRPVGHRRELVHAVERFLRWQAEPGREDGRVAVYLHTLRQSGQDAAEVAVAVEALEQLRAHLRTPAARRC
jgi:hypothetical protein